MNTQGGMTLRRELSAERINRVVNDPAVKRWVSTSEAELDLSPIVADPRNVLLCRDDGGMLFIAHSPGVYELHTMFLPSAGGSVARFARRALEWMFLRTDAMELYTRVPESNVRARRLCESFAAVVQFEGEGNGPQGRELVRVYRMAWSDWVLRAGFAERARELGLLPDPNIGATLAAMCAGMLDKGVVLFNRWSPVVGLAPMGLAQREPQAIVMFADKLWRVGESGLEALV